MSDSAQIVVVGAGTMGRGIAQVAAMAGHPTVLYDPRPEALPAARGSIEANLKEGVAKGKVLPEVATATLSHLLTSADPNVRRGAVVIEAAVERLDVKRE
ncbi:MAG: 3-hydroxyacyl-CoA dehydrogenase NAD-binding domain-containing protein, partial [Catalinimonas sp.]